MTPEQVAAAVSRAELMLSTQPAQPGPAETLVEALTDLTHWADAHTVDFASAAADALTHHDEETRP